jgi:hypothetical protein
LNHLLLRLAMSYFPLGKSKYAKLGNKFYAMLMLTDFNWYTTGSNRVRLRSLLLNLWNALAVERLSASQVWFRSLKLSLVWQWIVKEIWEFLLRFLLGNIAQRAARFRPASRVAAWTRKRVAHFTLLPCVGFPTFACTLQTRLTVVSERFLWSFALATGCNTGKSSAVDMSLSRGWCWRPKPSGMWRPIDLYTVTYATNDLEAFISRVEQRCHCVNIPEV